MARKLQIFGNFPSGDGTGANGLSAYEIAKKHGFVGTEEEWLNSLKGEQGYVGPQGPKGDDYVLTNEDKTEIAEQAASMVEVPEGGTVTPEQIASAVEDYMAEHPVTGGSVELDTSLTQSGKAADAKVVGDKMPIAAEIDDTGLASFKNAAGVTLFTLDLSGLQGDVFFGNVVISAESIEVAEGGAGTFTVCLETAPSVNQPVYLAVSDNTRLSVSPASLIFTPDNYDTEQIVTVTALQDDDEDDNSVTVTLTSRKVDARQVVVVIGDDDRPVITQDGLALYFNYRGHTDDTSTTITDEVHGVTASNFDAFIKDDNGIYGQGTYKYMNLTLTDEAGLAFKEMMNQHSGFTVELFGTMIPVGAFYCPNYRSLIGSNASYANDVNTPWKMGAPTSPTCILSDGSTDFSKCTDPIVITVDGVQYNIQSNDAYFSKLPYYGEFVHAVATFSSDGVIRTWLNGIRFDNGVTIENFVSWDIDTMFGASMSMISSAATQDRGYVSTQRIYNRVLTEDEIKNNMRVEAENMSLSTF